ncbi:MULTISPECIES: MarR family transcriptional regulator [Parabacteroides]|uniref:MarR family winged helix-turn-helix transcriptional regulator n=1 Tax=Parabacteroides TaxID=375288 RepID=UPI00094F12BA|nr:MULTISPECIES: MarR family transcriptional regulator [Parabacteroides]MCL3854073.1 MarR family transcriptional regulator [Parabacteroides leei]
MTANGELAHELNLLVLKTRMTFRQTIQRLLKQNNIDMTFEMLQIMHCLWKEQGVSQQTLAEKTAKDKACLTNLINNLEKKNWVIRQEDSNDRRNKLIFLTPEGEEMARRIKSMLKDMYDQIGERMNPRHMESCMKQLTKLNEIFDKI